MADALQAFLQFLIDIFAALSGFLGGKVKSLNSIINGLSDIENNMTAEPTTEPSSEAASEE